jgi:hypothetical protein
LGRKLGLPLGSVIARKPKPERPPSPFGQVLRGVGAVAILLIAGAAAAEYLFHDKIPYLRRTEKIGVPIGVPDAAKFASAPTGALAKANQPTESSPPPVIADATNKSTTPMQPNAKTDRTEGSSPAQNTSEQVAVVGKQSEPSSPAIGPPEPQTTPPDADQSASTDSDESSEATSETKKRAMASSRRSTSENPRTARSYTHEGEEDRGQNSQGRGGARIIGRTPDGRPVVKLTSGRVVILPRHYDDNGIYRSRPRRRVYYERPDDFVPPSQPFYPGD